MSATSFEEVRATLASVVTNGTGLRCSAYITDVVNAPCGMIGWQPYDPRLVFGGSKSVFPFQLSIYVPRTAEVNGQKLLDSYLVPIGSVSVIAAIQNGDLWPGSLVDYAQVTQVSGAREVEMVDGTRYLVGTIDMEVVW
jgi:hypothetical protein